MKNSGKELELLVKTVEEILLPKGFKITTRDRIYNDAGVQVAELDILIEGKLSTTEIKWLIECRDRPSDGPAPGSWIEQLVGRRDRFLFNKVTAVSTTGFSQGAIEYAQDSGIEIRSVEEITKEEILKWCSITEITFDEYKGDLKSLTIFTLNASEEQVEEFKEIIQGLSWTDEIFVDTGTGEKFSASNIWKIAFSRILNERRDVFSDIKPGDKPTQKELIFNYTNPNSRYKLLGKDSEIHIKEIGFIADISIVRKLIPLSKITRYTKDEGNTTIAESVHFELSGESDDIGFTIHKIDDQSGTGLLITATGLPKTPPNE